MVKTKKAFTLVETIISLIIIMIVAICSLSSLTKMKPRIEAVTLRGQYGCWYWDSSVANSLGIHPTTHIADGQLVEWYFDERTERTNDPIVIPSGSSCSLKLDQRPAHYYILAAGAGNSNNFGQVTTIYTPAISSNLNIEIGKINENLKTSVAHGDQQYLAQGAVSGTFEVSNITHCNVLKDTTNKITSCKIVRVDRDNILDSDFEIMLNGLEDTDIYGNQNSALVKFGELALKGGISSAFEVDFNKIPISSPALAALSANHADSFVIQKPSYEYNNSELTFGYYNSSLVPANQILNYQDFQNNNYSSNKRSKMTKVIENISIRRRSKLTELFKGLNAGGINRNGAVFIMW